MRQRRQRGGARRTRRARARRCPRLRRQLGGLRRPRFGLGARRRRRPLRRALPVPRGRPGLHVQRAVADARLGRLGAPDEAAVMRPVNGKALPQRAAAAPATPVVHDALGEAHELEARVDAPHTSAAAGRGGRGGGRGERGSAGAAAAAAERVGRRHPHERREARARARARFRRPPPRRAARRGAQARVRGRAGQGGHGRGGERRASCCRRRRRRRFRFAPGNDGGSTRRRRGQSH